MSEIRLHTMYKATEAIPDDASTHGVIAKEEGLPAKENSLPNPDKLLRKIVEEDDLKGFELLHNHYYNLLCNFACRFVASKEAAQDVVSEVFFRFWKNRKTLKIQTSCRAYFFTAVKNQSYNYLNREAKYTTSLEYLDSSVCAQARSPEELYLYHELSGQIASAINSLSPQCRKVFTLSRYGGLKNDEVAQKLNISTKAVEAHITRALKSLKCTLKNELLYLIFICSCLF